MKRSMRRNQYLFTARDDDATREAQERLDQWTAKREEGDQLEQATLDELTDKLEQAKLDELTGKPKQGKAKTAKKGKYSEEIEAELREYRRARASATEKDKLLAAMRAYRFAREAAQGTRQTERGAWMHLCTLLKWNDKAAENYATPEAVKMLVRAVYDAAHKDVEVIQDMRLTETEAAWLRLRITPCEKSTKQGLTKWPSQRVIADAMGVHKQDVYRIEKRMHARPDIMAFLKSKQVPERL